MSSVLRSFGTLAGTTTADGFHGKEGVSGSSPSGQRAERLVELSAFVERLVRVMDPSYIAVWLRKPVPALDDDPPLDVIARGDYRRVSRLISALEASPTT